MWFITKVKYNKENEQGLLKKVNEHYLINADSFTETETRIYEKLGEIIRGDFNITDISKTPYADIFRYDDDIDTWFKCKVNYYVVDEDSGKEKRVNQYFLITANTAKQAYDRIFESLSNMLVTFTVPDIVETKIVEVFEYEKNND